MAAAHQPLRAHEDIVVFYKAPATYNPLRTKRKGVHSPRRLSSTFSGHHGKTIWTGFRDPEFAHPTSVLRFSTKRGGGRLHPTEKPVALLEYLIRTYSNAGDLVLDPFCGGGGVGLAAIKTGRRALLFEKDRDYHEKASAVIEAANQNGTATRIRLSN